jgi:ribonuclease E
LTSASPAAPGEATSESRPERGDRPEGERGERSGRRSRRGGRRRRREPGEAVGGTEAGGSESIPPSGSEGAPEPQSFDFERAPVEQATPAPRPEPRPEWTPGPPSDATREGPRSEP